MADAIPARIKPARKPLTQERLKELLHYDPGTGVFTWKKPPSFRVSIGCEAGTISHINDRDHFYRVISIDRIFYRAHRLTMLYMLGYIPRYVDHKDRDTLNNRFLNLRPCTQTQNNGNQKIRKDSRNGYKGIEWHPVTRKWRARLSYKGKRIYLGVFSSPQEAHAAYARGAKKYFGEFARAE